MRGRPNDPVKAKAKARAHAKHAHFCSCGMRVHGNGGKASHRAAHERRGDARQRGGSETSGFGWITREMFYERFPEQRPALGW